MLLNGSGNLVWDTIKETMNFLSSTKARASGSEGKRDGDIGRAIERYWYHWIWDTRYSELKVMIACNQSIVEGRTIHWDVSESVLWEVLLETSQ
jgi:hypothetical protein